MIREEDHDRSDDDESHERMDMTVNVEARDKEKRREAFLASQAPIKSWSFSNNYNVDSNLKYAMHNLAVSDDESEHGNEEEEWEAQQIRKGVTGAQVIFNYFIFAHFIYHLYGHFYHHLLFIFFRSLLLIRIRLCNNSILWV